MTERRFHRNMVMATTIILLTVLLAIVGIRAELTRDEVFRGGNTACAKAAGNRATQADRVECDRIRREARLTEPLSDSCIIQRRTLKSGWYERITQCPPLAVEPNTVRASP